MAYEEQVAGRTLQHRADPARPQPRQRRLAHPGYLVVSEEDLARGRTLDAAEEGPGPRRTQEGDPLARLDVEVDTLEGDDVVTHEGPVQMYDATASDAQPALRAVDRIHAEFVVNA